MIRGYIRQFSCSIGDFARLSALHFQLACMQILIRVFCVALTLRIFRQPYRRGICFSLRKIRPLIELEGRMSWVR